VAAFRLRSIVLRYDAPDQAEQAPSMAEALAGANPQLRIGSLVQDVARDTRLVEEVGMRFASARAFYDELRTRGRMEDLRHEREGRTLRAWGAAFRVPVLHVRSDSWAAAEWAAMIAFGLDEQGPVYVASARRAWARRLEIVLESLAAAPSGPGALKSLPERMRAAVEREDCGHAYLWVSPWFWRAPAGTWGRVTAAMWRGAR
jgi:hypothetical protein